MVLVYTYDIIDAAALQPNMPITNGNCARIADDVYCSRLAWDNSDCLLVFINTQGMTPEECDSELAILLLNKKFPINAIKFKSKIIVPFD